MARCVVQKIHTGNITTCRPILLVDPTPLLQCMPEVPCYRNICTGKGVLNVRIKDEKDENGVEMIETVIHPLLPCLALPGNPEVKKNIRLRVKVAKLQKAQQSILEK